MMNKIRYIAAVTAALGAANAHAVTEPAANQVDTMSIVWLCAAAAAIVFGAIFYSFVAFRYVESKTSFVPKRLQELVWALVPMAIVIAAAAPAVRDTSLATAKREAHETLARAELHTAPLEIESQMAHR